MGLAEDQGQPGKGRGSEGGGQTRGETDLSTFIIGFNLQLFPQGVLEPQNMCINIAATDRTLAQAAWSPGLRRRLSHPLPLSLSQWQQRGEQQQGEQRQQRDWHSHRRAYTIHPQRWSR